MRQVSRAACLAVASILACLGIGPLADVELVLVDGRVVRGTDVRREGGLYVLGAAGGGTTVFPDEIVVEVRPEQSGAGSPPAPGLRVTEPRVLAGPPEPVVPPRPREQLAAFGEPSRWQRGSIDSTWAPRSDWPGSAGDPRFDERRKSTWAKGPVDPSWEPKSAFAGRPDALEARQATWSRSIVESGWKPRDGFRR